jgi:arylsulfatase A-like enzyme
MPFETYGEGDATAPPNIVFVLVDDLGYGDLGCYGAPGNPSPNIDRLAEQGMRLADFYVAQAVCSASRASFLTGRFPQKLGIRGALGPSATHGLETSQTLPLILKTRGYQTAIFGKWHLGHTPEFLPTRRGFDVYFGLPYSNDMGPLHPTPHAFPDLPLYEGEKILAKNPDQRTLTTLYTEHALKFIAKHANTPFFLYVPHTMPHVPLFVSKERAGATSRGVYADVVSELDWSVGQILAALEQANIDNNTIVIFASDNGPWISYGNHAGSTGGLREGKMTSFEGGVRVPFIVRWPGHVPAGTTSATPVMSIDLLPTLLKWLDVPAPTQLDGIDISDALEGRPVPQLDARPLFFYWNDELQAIRQGRWKLHLPHHYESLERPGADGRPGSMHDARIESSLFDLETDRAESRNVADQQPEITRQLETQAQLRRTLDAPGL